MDVREAIMEQMKVVKEMENLEVYSPEWWEKISDTVTLVPPELRSSMVFAVVFGSIQM